MKAGRLYGERGTEVKEGFKAHRLAQAVLQDLLHHLIGVGSIGVTIVSFSDFSKRNSL